MKFRQRLMICATFSIVFLVFIHRKVYNGNLPKKSLRNNSPRKLAVKNASYSKEKQEDLMKVHDRVNKKFKKSQILKYYENEKISQRIYGERVLDIRRDKQILMKLFPNRFDEPRDRVTDQLRTKINVERVKTIFIQDSKLHDDAKFNSDDCNVKKCKFTSDLTHLIHADAICWKGFMPNNIMRQKAKKSQIFINYQLESPANYGLFSKKHELNWTATYRRDSVLNTPYERFTPFLNVTDLPKKPKRNFAEGKRKQVAWFVSNCAGSNYRMSYVKELQKFINVDVYGRCGALKCTKSDLQCSKLLNMDYKFYLAFENSNCKDFVSEKFFFNGLSHDVIPIVMGAHPDEYKEVAPPNSYIHVDEFESPQLLAQYLHFLDQHDDLYNQYFLWKDTGRFINTKFMCRLCTMVHLAPLFPMWYTKSNEWWSNRDICVSPTLQNGILYSTWRGKKPSNSTSNDIHYDYNRNI